MCSDPSITYLKRFGFNVIRLPHRDIKPCDVLVEGKDRLERLGPADHIWRSPKSLVLNPPSPASHVDGLSTRAFGLKASLSILDSLGLPFGISGPSLGTSINHSCKLSFSFGRPEIWGVNLIDLGLFIAEGKVDPFNPVIQRYFIDRREPVHLIVDLLLSSSLIIGVHGEISADLESKMDTLASDSNIKCTVQKSTRNLLTLKYDGPEKLAFGFRAIQVLNDNGWWKVKGYTPPGSTLHADPVSPRAWSSMFSDSQLQIETVATSE